MFPASGDLVSGISRRKVLQTILLASGVSVMPLWKNAWAAQTAAAGGSRLVVVFMRGAVDGLSVVVPYKDQNYHGLRPNIGLAMPGQDGGVLDLDGYFGLNPALSSLMPLWQQKQLAFVHASGQESDSRSHFDAQANMEAGAGNGLGTSGWMNRLLASLPGAHTPTQAVSYGPTLPLIMKGQVSVQTMEDGGGAKSSLIDRPNVAAAFDRMYTGGSDAISQSYVQGKEARQEIATDLGAEEKAANGGAPIPNGAFAKNTSQLGKLMQKDASMQLAFMALGGWDTHVGQGNGKGKLANTLKPLGDGLATLASSLGPVWNDTVVLVISEFGRTVKENGGGGTDHGHGNVMWVLGGAVNGGHVYGSWPTLDSGKLYQGRDLAVTTDFRVPITAVLERHFKLPDAAMASVFPNAPKMDPRWGAIVKA